MRHYKKGRKLGTDKSHTKAMKRNLVSALFLNDRIKTIESRAKEIRPDVDKIIKWAKKGDLHSRRLAIAALGGDKYLVQEIFEKVDQGMFGERNSGYTRIIKLGHRKGDNAPMVIIELVNEGKKRDVEKESSKKSVAKRLSGRRTAKKKEKEAEEAKVKDEAEKSEKAEEEANSEKPEEKAADKPEEKSEEKAEEGAEEKAADKPEEKADDKPAEEKKPEEKKTDEKAE